ncbi:uncharacterized protein UTRI_10326 [Ustilago trichophora]|uniref:Zn(2)-C6 fungal-type domain-containing protein n=1 Tax=Ustilago trichophora TaxID=86804 RepID=A0A5C3E9W3_9BASI|nr:uncharacterized protein UTRI_10326 [Ustilago trichophora]
MGANHCVSVHSKEPTRCASQPIPSRSDLKIMPIDVATLPSTVAYASFLGSASPNKRSWAPSATEPASEAAQCLVSMSSTAPFPAADTASTLSSALDTTTHCQEPRPSSPRVRHSKPGRLSLACNTCRKRKVRCDAHQPKCHNCIRRGDVCVTSDPRRPNASIALRRRTARRSPRPPSVNHKQTPVSSLESNQPAQSHAPTDNQDRIINTAAVPDHQDNVPSERNHLDDDDDNDDDEHGLDFVDGTSSYPESSSRRSSSDLPQSVSHMINTGSASDAVDVSHHSSTYQHHHHARSPSYLQPQVGQSEPERFSPSSASISTPLPENSSTRNSIRSTESLRRIGGNNQGHQEFPSWVSRAYHEVSAEHERNIVDPRREQSSTPTADVVVHTDGSPHRLKVLGGSSLQCLFKFTDVSLAGYGYDATAPLFRHGMTQSDEFEMPLFPALPNLPPEPLLSRCIDAFFNRVWPLFPAVDRDNVRADASYFLNLQSEASTSSMDANATLQSKVQASRVPNLVVLYAIICIGMGELPPSDPMLTTCHHSRTSYLTASYSLHSHLSALPYLVSVQALLLLALSLRSCGKDGQSWYITGLAIRLAVSLGLQKNVATERLAQQQKIRPHLMHDYCLERRLWWSCYSLERLLQLECGRASSINTSYDYMSIDSHLNIQPYPTGSAWQPSGQAPSSQDGNRTEDGEEADAGHAAERNRINLFTAWVSLASIMGQISDRFYNYRFGHATEMLGETARLAQSLTMWETTLPENLNSQSSSFGIQSGHDQVLAVFLAQQFYYAQIAVLRVAILFPQQGFRREVQKRTPELPEIKRLLGAASQCMSAARGLITLTLQTVDAGLHSTLIGAPQTFMASVVVALNTLRSPRSRLARSDMELLNSATSYVEGCYEEWGYPSAFLSIFSRLRERTGAVTNIEQMMMASLGYGQVHGSLNTNTNVAGLSGQAGAEAFTNMEFEDLWDMLKADIFM